MSEAKQYKVTTYGGLYPSGGKRIGYGTLIKASDLKKADFDHWLKAGALEEATKSDLKAAEEAEQPEAAPAPEPEGEKA